MWEYTDKKSDVIEEFFTYINHGNLFKVKNFISKGLDVNYQNCNGWTSLMAASVAGQHDVLKYLLEAGADVNLCRDKDLSSPLLTAIDLTKTSEEQCLKCVNLLVSGGAQINAADILGKTPLMAAAEMDMPNVILFLLAAGANINLLDRDDKSALRWAIEKSSQNALKALLEGPAVPRLGKAICHLSVNLAIELKNRYFAALIQKHITSTITEKDWLGLPEDIIDAVLSSRVDVVVTDCKNMAESHLFSWDLPMLIPLFRMHRITESVLPYMTDADLQSIGVQAVYRSKITQELDTLFFKHNKGKMLRGTAMPGVTFAETFSDVENMKEHLIFLYATFGHHIKDKIIADPTQLTKGMANYGIPDLIRYCANCTRSLEQLKANVAALNNTIIDVDEGEDECRRLQSKSHGNTIIKMALFGAVAVVAIIYGRKKYLG